MTEDARRSRLPQIRALRRLRLSIAVPALALVGMLVSGYLTYVHWFGIEPLCGELGDCELVNSSVYAEVNGVPVALLGFLGYASLFALGLVNVQQGGRHRRVFVSAIFGLSLAGTSYSGWLTYIELFVLRAICAWCVASAATITATLVVSLVLLVRDQRT